MVKSSDFVIWGPSVTAGSAALTAVHALYFLPDRFKLVMPPIKPEEKDSYEKVLSLVRRDGLDGRVSFSGKHVNAAWQAVVVADPTDRRPGHIFGKTPEALASAILQVSRTA